MFSQRLYDVLVQERLRDMRAEMARERIAASARRRVGGGLRARAARLLGAWMVKAGKALIGRGGTPEGRAAGRGLL